MIVTAEQLQRLLQGLTDENQQLREEKSALGEQLETAQREKQELLDVANQYIDYLQEPDLTPPSQIVEHKPDLSAEILTTLENLPESSVGGLTRFSD